MTHDDAPLPLTPYPRPSHIIRLRQERERRRRRRSIGVAVATAALAVVSGTAASSLGSAMPRESAGPVQLASGEVAKQAAETLDSATDLLTRAEKTRVDASTLTGYVDYLEDYEGLPASVASNVTADANAEIDRLEPNVTQAEKNQERRERKEREEREAREAEEAAALAEANTVEGAKATASELMSSTYGWGADQFGCLDALWTKESGWNYQAANPSSGAYGIPQSLPGSKMGTIADDWATNATTQITWGLDYISRAYGTPCAAWGHSQAVNWY